MTIDINSDAYKLGYEQGYMMQISFIDNNEDTRQEFSDKITSNTYTTGTDKENFKAGVENGKARATKDRNF